MAVSSVDLSMHGTLLLLRQESLRRDRRGTTGQRLLIASPRPSVSHQRSMRDQVPAPKEALNGCGRILRPSRANGQSREARSRSNSSTIPPTRPHVQFALSEGSAGYSLRS